MKEFIEELKHNQKINIKKGLENRVNINYVIERLEDVKKEEKQQNDNIKKLVAVVDDILTRYTNDEAGQGQKKQYKTMTEAEKLTLFVNTVLTCADWCDFETDLVINFDYNNY